MPQAASPSLAGSFRFFQAGGISVYVHWSWFVVGILELQFRSNEYNSQVWNVAEYLALFAIVLMHEFGHALACRQVGGQANEIVLWPLGGIAFVSPPARPGALLWSIAAGPLVNVFLVPITVGLSIFASLQGMEATQPDAFKFLSAIMVMNLVLLVFNMLPIYPLDGGQILQALLWFVIGRSRSLMVVSVIGIIAAVAFIGLAIVLREIWIGIMAVFGIFRSLAGFQQARLLAEIENAPCHEDAACPSCHAHPLAGDYWTCDECQTRFDTFSHMGECPRCGKRFAHRLSAMPADFSDRGLVRRP